MDARMRMKTALGAAVFLVGIALCASPARAQSSSTQGSSAQGSSGQDDTSNQLQPFILAQQQAFLRELAVAQQQSALARSRAGQFGGAYGQGGFGQGGFGQGGFGQGGFGQGGFGQGSYGQGGFGLGGSGQMGFGTPYGR
jgi:rSAM-associated Gly-rich repeat protein